MLCQDDAQGLVFNQLTFTRSLTQTFSTSSQVLYRVYLRGPQFIKRVATLACY
mgnify:CR=1 FL=1